MAKSNLYFYAEYFHKIAIHAKNLAHLEHVHAALDILASSNEHL
ncbi:hypothetical protein J812_2641 [Acinetobacter baumannii 25977_9]|nr:hypothetical protein J811_0849 [Acinetobacter sp. 25977_8]EXT47366.1 hypothetical protein J810_0468 [Acinetobacter sp. 25977_7]EXT67171.1 hypothetical protein J813_3087 [Acinetobacter sp. 25977_10]KCZ31045.1 hypothetical protein J812_2641 [Acinetobacter baumannii 25977_9]